jgi:AcrR family transcriptional regulator
MPKVTQAHLDARRMQILRAATRCFARQGFHRTTMQDIVRASRLSPGAIYRYFKGKDAIVEAMVACRQEDRAQKLAGPGNDSPGGSALTYLLQTLFHPLEGDDRERAIRRVIIQVWAETLRNPRIRKAVRENMRALRDPIAARLAEAQRRGELRGDLNANAIALVMMALLQGFILHEALGEEAEPGQYLAVIKAALAGLQNGAEVSRGRACAPEPSPGIQVSGEPNYQGEPAYQGKR